MTSNKRKIEIYDTTLRDGAQSEGVSLSVEDKLMVARAIDELGVDYIEGGYPLSNPKDAAFFAQLSTLQLRHARMTAFGMTRRKDVKVENDAGMEALLASQAPVVTIVGKSWDMHLREVLRVSDKDNLAMIADSVGLCVEEGREVIYDAEHFFDGWVANAQYAIATLEAAFQAGATCLSLCDTNGGTTPESLVECIQAVRAAIPEARLAIHAHNDNGLAVSNSLLAVQNGVVQVQGTINGIGERCGNADLTSVIPNLIANYGYDCLHPDTLSRLTEVSRFVYEAANLNLRPNQPFVGSAAFAHKGGMHVHAVQKNTATYEHLDPAIIGNTRRILVSEVAGKSNITAMAQAKFGLDGDKLTQQQVLDAVMEMEAEGYQFESAEASFEMLVRKTLASPWYHALWQLDHYRCVIFKQNGHSASTEAIVKIVVNGQSEHKVAEARGPVDSLHGALWQALQGHYPGVDQLQLVDYKVRVVNTQAGTAAKVRVVIEWHDADTGAYFGSVGVSENIIDASWFALVDAVEYKLMNDAEESRNKGSDCE